MSENQEKGKDIGLRATKYIGIPVTAEELTLINRYIKQNKITLPKLARYCILTHIKHANQYNK